jgi:hypothetical protein
MENLAQEVQELRRCGNTRQVENLDVGSHQRKINKRKKRWIWSKMRMTWIILCRYRSGSDRW